MHSCTLAPALLFLLLTGTRTWLLQGYFSNSTGQSECQPCRPGFHADGPGRGVCEVCSVGYYVSVNASVVCFTCAPVRLMPSLQFLCAPIMTYAAAGVLLQRDWSD
jgi:hypothetical protein